jgi:hypothetical protein
MKVIRVLNDTVEGYKTNDNYTYHIVWSSYNSIGEVVFDGDFAACEDFINEL